MLAALLSGAAHPGWPISTPVVHTRPAQGPGFRVRLRPLRRSDGGAWCALRRGDMERLRPVEPTVAGDWAEFHSPPTWRRMCASLRATAVRGALIPAVIEVDGRFAGQLTLGNIQHGVVSSCWIGYWVYSAVGGAGVATAAVALGTDHAVGQVGLHRVEATVMEGNHASRRVLERTGFRVEGRLQRNLHINGRWQDHLLVAQTAEETGLAHGGGVVARLVEEGRLIRG
ncbi:GNAT family N-acetyltransferase [Corynebacterium heidelbergense]|uniref:GNAT family N-acetyltransferase n=1 Tax=Corynebacterium heidelbergense TaxID=2055947 RepID=A0A364VA72_9CORY|nr:GNAT family protein [Corynebacterium heidelbergense]RAV33466.1 GNAT family N-acetyltransferase [Corynebacterium heidelbergense]WCZ37126.1 Putative ribosomal N-acetyltransferase YdaF [Corynebacterium heidelbergense]